MTDPNRDGAPVEDPVVTRLRGLYVAVVADVLDRMDLRHQVMAPGMRPVHAVCEIVARASTMQAVPSRVILDNPYEHELAAVDAVARGSVVVVNTGGVYDAAVWGELLTTRAMGRGAVGAIVDGGVRDVTAMERLSFPVFSMTVSANDSFGRMQVIDSTDPIVCGGVPVRGGDIVMADRDGVVVVPAEVAEEVAALAEGKRRKEAQARTELGAGASAAEVYGRHGVL